MYDVQVLWTDRLQLDAARILLLQLLLRRLMLLLVQLLLRCKLR